MRLILADDHTLVRAGIRSLLEAIPEVDVIAEASDGHGALELIEKHRPELALLDVTMPGLNGLELQQHLVRERISIPIIFISGHGGIPESVQAMKAGAVDFLEKPFRQHLLVECIESSFRKDLENRKYRESTRSARERYGQLTAREKEVAQFIIANPSHTSSKEIGRELDISPRTVDHHRARILEKMGIGSVAELIDLSASLTD